MDNDAISPAGYIEIARVDLVGGYNIWADRGEARMGLADKPLAGDKLRVPYAEVIAAGIAKNILAGSFFRDVVSRFTNDYDKFSLIVKTAERMNREGDGFIVCGERITEFREDNGEVRIVLLCFRL